MGRILSGLSSALATTFAIGALALSACGGGSGGEDPPSQPNALAGPYHYLMLARDAGGDVRSETGQLSADGFGTLTFGSSYVAEEGSSSGPVTRTPMSYAVAPNRDLTISDPGGLDYAGRLSINGHEASVSALPGQSSPAWMVLVRRDTAPEQAELTGEWGLVQWYRRAGAGEYAVSGRGWVTITATGVLTIDSYTYNLDGQINPVPLFHLAQDVVPGTDGWILGRNLPGSNVIYRGALSADGNLIVLGNHLGALGHAFVRILVRKNSLAGDAALSSVYASHGFRRTSAQYETWAGSMTFNGTGGGSWGRRFHSGGVTYSDSRNLTYGPIAEGVVAGHSGGDFAHVGHIGADARFVVLGGFYSATRSPLLDFLIR